MHLILLQLPSRENWFQHVCRVHTIEINFPCIITLPDLVRLYVYCLTARFLLKNQLKPSLVIEFNRSLQFTVSLCAYYYVN